jgi:hypothetical protein
VSVYVSPGVYVWCVSVCDNVYATAMLIYFVSVYVVCVCFEFTKVPITL